jgi:hypothetical protein
LSFGVVTETTVFSKTHIYKRYANHAAIGFQMCGRFTATFEFSDIRVRWTLTTIYRRSRFVRENAVASLGM